MSANRLFFVASDATSGEEIWSYDGFSTGTLPFVDLNSGAASSNPRELVDFGGTLYFVGDDSTSGREVYLADETFSTIVSDIRTGTASSDPDQLTVSGSALYFTANDGVNGRELWSTTGFAAFLASDIRTGANGSDPTNLTDVGGTLMFSANNGNDGFEPHQVSGSTVVQLSDINPGSSSSNPADFMASNGNIYFAAEDVLNGRELWFTDGTPAVIGLVADVQPGTTGSNPVPLFDTGKRLLFSASGTGTSDRELWDDGRTVGKTLLVEDLNPSVYAGSDPQELTEVNGVVYFSADNGLTGRETYTLGEQAPVVASIAHGGNAAGTNPSDDLQRSNLDRVALVFDSQVEIAGGSLTIRNRDTNTELTSLVVNTTFDSGQTIVEVTFGAGPSVVDRDPTGTSGLFE